MNSEQRVIDETLARQAKQVAQLTESITLDFSVCSVNSVVNLNDPD